MYILKSDISVYDDNYYKNILDDIKKDHGKEYLIFLEKNGAPLEYIDPLSEYALFVVIFMVSIVIIHIVKFIAV